MKYAVMSDLHANPAAFQAAIDDAQKQGCGRIVCLGDVTGYGYDPHACLDIVRRKAGFCLMGNHDSACVGLEPEWEVRSNPNYEADVLARQKLSPGETAWLSGLPYIHAENGAAFTHGTFRKPESWGYILSPWDAARSFEVRPEPLLFCGHTHHARLLAKNDANGVFDVTPPDLAEPAMKEADSIPVDLEEGTRYLVNVGSVGYPRRDYCSIYVIWDVEARRITYRRLPFDLEAYAQRLIENGIRVPIWLRDIIEFLKMYPG